ncbi:MarR family transcriptional regulator [Iningainema tapete]|uniref:MarR family transcriptional regulator n=1 Tax=Iningainema tapete BLCC-T55 TaxID=2748662 RepID=A0A8J6XLC0_9CYAN|nr:helix-turn-helix domain-containing protein [Iningainema tapete]MBD2776873.1 MarR family transcriptional regulator [Iningainema tapete BLCC-T55]
MIISEQVVEALRADIQRVLEVFKVEGVAKSDSPYSDLNISDIAVIMFIGQRQTCIVREVAEHLRLPLTTVSSIVERLVRRELVQRDRTETFLKRKSRSDRQY